MNATQWGAADKSALKKNNFGANLGGPAKIPGLWSSSVKSYFYAELRGLPADGRRQPAHDLHPFGCGKRAGDFSDWRDANGNLIPIYDPATTRVVNGVVVRDPFPGNIIPANRISPIARQFLEFLPTPDQRRAAEQLPGADRDTRHHPGRQQLLLRALRHLHRPEGPRGDLALAPARAGQVLLGSCPREIATETFSDPQNSWVNRANWDHTFGPNLLNHFAFGYLNRNEGYGCVNADAVDDLPKIAGVAEQQHRPPDQLQRRLQLTSGCNAGIPIGNDHDAPDLHRQRPHHLDQGQPHDQGRLRVPQHRRQHPHQRQRGGHLRLRSRRHRPPRQSTAAARSRASSSARWTTRNVTFRAVSTTYPRQAAYILHLGDTWKASSKLTLNYGLRWDYFTPSKEKYDVFSFFDPERRRIPSAGGRPGRLAFAGDDAGRPATARTTRRSPTRRPSLPGWA